jgi:hypothetical protein
VKTLDDVLDAPMHLFGSGRLAKHPQTGKPLTLRGLLTPDQKSYAGEVRVSVGPGRFVGASLTIYQAPADDPVVPE